ncbi:MAG TPA: hypothetical protein VH024_13500 [Candidatus Angelobacter sp.]|jgi:hypothetical protein|nr:hypothetical protein [Candidatus Angelobacter sp.]
MRQDFKSIATGRTIILKAAFTFLLFGLSLSSLAQYRAEGQSRPAFTTFRQDPGLMQGHYPGSQYANTSFALSEPNFSALFDQVRRESEQPGNYQSAAYQELVRRQCIRAAQEKDARFLENSCGWARLEEQDAAPHADPEAPDQSDLLKNSKDRDFILRNFRTMYVDARDAKYFGSRQLKAALGKNKDFWKLNVRMVDDPRVADVILKVSYTFAWDFPFELTHRNTTMVLLSGKGEGPFSGPLGAADVARNLVNLAKPWREKAAGK